MKWPELPYLEVRRKRTKAGLVSYWYFRRKPGKPIRLPDRGDPAFLAAYARAADGHMPTPSRTTIAALADSYMASGAFAKLGDRTKADYAGVLDHIRDVAGQHDVARITMPAVVAAMEANRERVRFANYIGQVYQVLCRHAVRIGWMQANPLVGLDLLPTPEAKRRPHIPWTDDAVAKMRKEGRGAALLAFELGLGTMQRAGDVRTLRWSAYDGQAITLAQGKTGAEVVIPCSPALKAALDAAPKRGLTILTNRHGQPLTKAAFDSMFYAERKRLDVLAHDFHALRYRGAMELAWAGCSDEEIMSYTGHASAAMVRKYAGKARQIMRARQAAAKRERNKAKR